MQREEENKALIFSLPVCHAPQQAGLFLFFFRGKERK
jgi:hypothetical protein